VRYWITLALFKAQKTQTFNKNITHKISDYMQSMVTQTELRKALVKISSMELEILQLKSYLLPKVKASKKELAAIEASERDIKLGLGISGEDFIKELKGL
jgi:hypothetical protein